MIAINKSPEPRKRPDPPWPIDAHASIFVEVLQASGQRFLHPSTVQLPSPDPFSSGVSHPDPNSPFTSPGLGTEPTSELTYSLFLNLELGNLNPFPIAFETVVIHFDDGPVPRNESDAIEQATIFTESGKIVSNFSYSRVNFRKSPSGETPLAFQIENRGKISLPAFALGAAREIEKRYAARFILQLFHQEVAVSRPVVASIPHEAPMPVRDPVQLGISPFKGLPIRFTQY